MDVIEADDASDGIKVSDEALEVKDGNTLNKHLKCLEKQIRKLYSIWTNLCKNFQWFI